jgi:flavin-binding protein dodecin
MKPTISQLNRCINVLEDRADAPGSGFERGLEDGNQGRRTRTRTGAVWLRAEVAPWVLLALIVVVACPTRAQETNRVNLNDFSAFKLIIDRNIFDPNRRPSRAFAARTERAAVDSFSLAGTISYANVLAAIFDGSKPDYHKALKTAEQIAGYTVSEIQHDAVKLSSGTNQVELKVGMQMRRSQDGKWSVSESAGSYASNSRRSDRRDNPADRPNPGRTSLRGSSPTFSASGNPAGTNAQPDLAGGPPSDLPPGAEMDAAPGSPPDAGGANDDDPVTRMMRRRQQETGGGQEGSQNE